MTDTAEGIGLDVETAWYEEFVEYQLSATPYNSKRPIGEAIEFAANAEIGALTVHEPTGGFQNGVKVNMDWVAPEAGNSGNLVVEVTWENLESAQQQVRQKTYAPF